MINAVARITLNDITDIDVEDFVGICFYDFLNEGLPYGYFTVNDKSSLYINEFENLQIGARVNIKLENVQDHKDTLTFPTFHILKIEDDFALDPFKFAGTLRVWFGHPWFLFKDDTNHAYNPMNNGKLIKKILEDKKRGLKFEINKDLFLDTDDTGKFSRYKVCESDWDFIKNKVLPFTTIQQLPPLFFCSLLKKKEETKYKFAFNLGTSADLFKQNSKIMITPTQEVLTEENNYKEIGKNCSKNNIDPSSDIYYFQSIQLKILNEKDIKLIFPRIFVDDIKRNKSLKLGSKVKNNLAKKSGSTFGNLLPLDTLFMNTTNGTSVSLIKNRRLLDALSLILSSTKNLDNIFNIIVETNFCGDKITIGDTVELFVPFIKLDEKEKIPWIKGKWIVYGIESYTNNTDDDKYKLSSRVYLNRPSFIGNINDITLSMYQMLYEAN
jgi:hypothetical protein